MRLDRCLYPVFNNYKIYIYYLYLFYSYLLSLIYNKYIHIS